MVSALTRTEEVGREKGCGQGAITRRGNLPARRRRRLEVTDTRHLYPNRSIDGDEKRRDHGLHLAATPYDGAADPRRKSEDVIGNVTTNSDERRTLHRVVGAYRLVHLSISSNHSGLVCVPIWKTNSERPNQADHDDKDGVDGIAKAG